MANTDVTLPNANKSVLSNQERAQGYTHKYKILFTDIDEGSGLPIPLRLLLETHQQTSSSRKL